MSDDNITSNDISMQIIDLQHQLLQYALARQLMVVRSCELIEDKLNHFRQRYLKQMNLLIKQMEIII
jgi:hypothetical protein